MKQKEHKIPRPAISRMKRDVMRKKLREDLARTSDEMFLRLIWSIDAIQSDRDVKKEQLLKNVPKEAFTSKITERYFAHKWLLETLVSELLVTGKIPRTFGPSYSLDCTNYKAFARVYNHLHELEGAEYGIRGGSDNILMEMHRIGQRQFPWQRGYVTAETMYRYHFIYGQGDCAAYFAETYGITIDHFSMLSVALYLQFGGNPWCLKPTIVDLDLPTGALDAALRLLTIELSDARKAASKFRSEAIVKAKGALRTAYQPSILRQFPVIFSKSISKGSYCAPLPDLIMYRATAGLYFYLRSGPQKLLSEANDRFELYAQRLIAAYCSRFDVLPNIEYKFKKNPVLTPDILIRDKGEVVTVFECKATKLTFDAQFADEPAVQAKGAYEQISKAVFQLWKFFSHARRGLISSLKVAAGAHGVVLTLEPWMQMSAELQAQAYECAKGLAAADVGIEAEDMRHVVFCSIQELEETLSISSEDEFLASLTEAAQPKYAGWAFVDARRRIGSVQGQPKTYPFDLGEILPWWKKLDDLK